MKYLLDKQETERLRFRLLKEADFDQWLEFFLQSDVTHFLGFKEIETPQQQCEEWFNLTLNRYKNDLGGLNVLIDKNTNDFIGQCGLLIQEVDDKKEMEIGYSMLPKFWNKGYATEAAQKCRDFAFENNFTDSLISIIHVDNIRSEKVALKNGMVKTKQTNFKGMPVNIFRIEKEAWLKLKNIKL